MISKAVRGQGFSGCISYVCEKASDVRTLNIASQNWKNAASEMRAVANTNATSKCVYHHWLSFSPDEKLSDEAMFKAAEAMISKLGLSDHQHVMAVHRDRDHAHIHIVSNLVSFDGKAQKLSHDYNSRPVFARQIEAELGLQKFQRAPLIKNANARSSKVFTNEKISQIQKALSSSRSFEDLESALKNIGLQIGEKSSRGNLLNYRITDIESGLYIAGSKIDPALSSPSALSKKFIPSQGRNESTDDRAEKIRSIIDQSSSWDESQRRLSAVGVTLNFIKSGERVRGIRFSDDHGLDVKASEIGISYSSTDKRFSLSPIIPKSSEITEISKDSEKSKKRYPDDYKNFKNAIWKEFKAIPKKKPDDAKIKRISDARNSEVYMLRQKAFKEIMFYKRLSFLERLLINLIMGFDAVKNAQSIIEIDTAKKIAEIDKKYGIIKKELYDDTNINLQSFLIQKHGEGVNPIFIQKLSEEILEKEKIKLQKNNVSNLKNLNAKPNKSGEGVFYEFEGKKIIWCENNMIYPLALDETTLVLASKLSAKTKMKISGTSGVVAAFEQYQKNQFLKLQKVQQKKADPRSSRTAQPEHVESVPEQKGNSNVTANRNRVGRNSRGGRGGR